MNTPTRRRLPELREHGVECRQCTAATEDMLAQVEVGQPVQIWCHRCEQVTERKVIW